MPDNDSRLRRKTIPEVRARLLDMKASYDPPDELVAEQEALTRVMDAWDEYEYAAGTHEGGAHEVVS